MEKILSAFASLVAFLCSVAATEALAETCPGPSYSQGVFRFSNKGRRVVESGRSGGWVLWLDGDRPFSAAEVARTPGAFSEEVRDGVVESRWTTEKADVVVHVRKLQDGSLSAQARITPKTAIATRFEFPAPIEFLAKDVSRFVQPANGTESVGLSFNPRFFASTNVYQTSYPPLFADWSRIETIDGAALQIFGVQHRGGFEPWRNPNPFVPGLVAVGGLGNGRGFYRHEYLLWIKPGKTFTTPTVRLTSGGSENDALLAYLKENGLGRSLREKCAAHHDPGFAMKLAAAPMLLLYGNAAQISNAVDRLPVPTLVHNTSYKRGGQDGGNPDCLPPDPSFGSESEFRALIDHVHRRGHLFMPYVNPTYWCDKPKYETFIREGMEPIARNRDGSPIRLQYGIHPCFNTTYFHPAVQAANRRTRTQFLEEYPSDLMFQDQCGSLGPFMDFSTNSPSPTAHSEGMISIVEEDRRFLPLMTEDGWDMIADNELGLTGVAWQMIPLEDMCGRTLYKKKMIPADMFTFDHVAGRLFRDKLFFYHHDLAGFTTNDRTLVWMLALGYNFVFRCHAVEYVRNPRIRRWFEWLHVLQSKVLARTMAGRVESFEHDRTPLFERGIDPASSDDDGVIKAVYGGVCVLANLGDVPRTVEGHPLDAYGWWIDGPGVRSAKLEGEMPYVETADGRFGPQDAR